MSGIGPALPPHLLAKRKRQQDDEPSDAPATASGAKLSPSPEAAEKRRRVAGPALPPAPLDERPTKSATAATEEDSSDDDDGFGPALPSAPAANQREDEENNFDSRPARPAPPPVTEKLRRDDWMTMPPEQDGLAARMDPTKQRARGFNTSKGAKAPPPKGGDSSAWHETPEQKRKRLEDEMMGISRPEPGVVKDTESSRKARDAAAAKNVKEHTEKHRGPSLMEQHKTRKPDEAEDDPSKRAFDREKDIGSGILGRAERKDFLSKSASFTSKFSGGSYL